MSEPTTQQFTLTDKQSAVVRDVQRAAESQDFRLVTLRGYAGTGKTLTVSRAIHSIAGDDRLGPVVVATPTATALSVVQSKLATDRDSRGIILKTFSSLAQTPVQAVTLMRGKRFVLTPDGVRDLHKFLSRMGVKTDGLVVIRHKGDVSVVTDLTRPESFCPNNAPMKKCRMYFDTDAFRRAVAETFGSWADSPFTGPDADTEFRTQPPRDVARRILWACGEETPALFVLDEASMVCEADQNVLTQACRFLNCTLLVCGDPAQIPPIQGESNRTLARTSGDCVHTLDEVLRSGDSVIDIATKVRAGESIGFMDDTILETGEAAGVFDRNVEVFRKADVALTFTNKNVNYFNEFLRAEQGRNPVQFEAGEQIMGTRNVFGPGLAFTFFNGDIFTIARVGSDAAGETEAGRLVCAGVEVEKIRKTAAAGTKKRGKRSKRGAKGLYNRFMELWETGRVIAVESEDGRVAFTWADGKRHGAANDRMMVDAINGDADIAVPFVLTAPAAAVTVNKAQGSEWGNVVYVTFPKDRKFQAKELPYTAVTRARDSITVIWVE